MDYGSESGIMLIKAIMMKSLSIIDGLHTERVVKLCEGFLTENPSTPIDLNLLLKAAWIHDVAKKKAGKRHANPKYVEAALQEVCSKFVDLTSTSAEDFEKILVIISAHNDRFTPSCSTMESAVLRMCDKLDKCEKAKDRYLIAKIEHLRAKECYTKDDKRRIRAKKERDKAENRLTHEPALTIESCAKNLYVIEHSGLLNATEFSALERFTFRAIHRL